MKHTINAVLIFIALLYVFTACAYKPRAKGYVCIEKPPFKVTYIDYERDITPQTVHNLIGNARWFPYKNTKMNDKNEVVINYDESSCQSSSNANTMTIKK